MNPTPKLGILGLGSRTTSYYVSELNRLYNKKLGGYSTCPFLLLNTDFDQINPLLPQTSKELDYILSTYLKDLKTYGVKHLIIPNITLFETVERLTNSDNVIHPVNLCTSHLQKKKYDKVMLIGSQHSMQSDYITNELKRIGIKVVLPSKNEMEEIDSIRKKVYDRTESKRDIERFHEITKTYQESYPIVIACTEFSIITPQDNKKFIDLAQLQMEEAIQIISPSLFCLNEK